MIHILTIIYKDIDQSCYSDDGKTLIHVDDSSPNLRISAKCEIIKDSCFERLKSLFSFSFEDNPNFTTLGNKCFSSCTNLASINLSSCNKLTKIYVDAFYLCSQVTEILLPKGLLEIKEYVFYGTRIVSITIPASVEKIGKYAFLRCSSLEKVIFEPGSKLGSLEDLIVGDTKISSFEIPENISKVHGYFSNNKVTKLTINPNNQYLRIENNMIYSSNFSILFSVFNRKLSNYTIPNTVTTIGDFCFCDLEATTFNLPNSLTTIGYNCFQSSNLITLTIPESVKSIKNSVFFQCNNLKNVTFLGAIDFIGPFMFISCNNLELIIFPNSPMIINTISFITNNNPKANMSFTHKTLFSQIAITRASNITVSYLNEPNLVITTNSLVMDYDQTTIYEFWGYNYLQITIPNTVTKICSKVFENSTVQIIQFEENSHLSVIGNSAFRNCSNLKLINFSSNTVITIMGNVFEDCLKLENISNLNNIFDYCFHGCIKLKNADIREGSEKIGVGSFDSCFSLESINIPSTVKIISDYAFNHCNKLKSIIFTEMNSLEKILINSISNCESLSNISSFSSNQYKCESNTLYNKRNSKYYLIHHLCKSHDRVLILNCDVICSYSFNQSIHIENVSIISNSVSLIETNSFNNCNNLKYINFPFCVEIVEPFSFNKCHSIRCPLIIENTSIDYLKMINQSGIPIRLMIKCKVVQGSNILQNIRKLYNSSAKIFFRHLCK